MSGRGSVFAIILLILVVGGVAGIGLILYRVGTTPPNDDLAEQQKPVDRDPVAAAPTASSSTIQPIDLTVTVPQPHDTDVELLAGQTIEISCRVERPSQLPANGRLLVRWSLLETLDGQSPPWPETELPAERNSKDLQIPQRPTADWSKVLHALDPDVYVVYRAPVSGRYRLHLEPAEDEIDLFEGDRWRESGRVTTLTATPRQVAWPKDASANLQVAVRPVAISSPAQQIASQPQQSLIIETEPNDTPEQAVLLPIGRTSEEAELHVVGGSDDVEYFDNGRVGNSGDDWFRLDYEGDERRLLTACLSIPDQQVAARIRCYTVSKNRGNVDADQWIPITKAYTAGKNTNERPHQQTEAHRIAINRTLRPGNVYFLRVEANAPGYELEVRIVEPAPFEDPRRAIRHALYDHLGQVDSWLVNRPRSISVERRIRDTGNLLGSGCMSCHTQAGVWGPAIPFAHGYRPHNVQLMRNLVNLCYQSMRPTNELVDAANNASLSPLDLGDGPAGTRVTGHAVVAYERYREPRRLHSSQAIRAANNVLQTSDPSAVNAAGPGANVGEAVVLNYAAEIVAAAWKSSGDPKYFRALEDKARRMLRVKPKFADDLCHRIEMLSRYFPDDYVTQAASVSKLESELAAPLSRVPYEAEATTPEQARLLTEEIERQVAEDLQRLRAIQNDDGSWGFHPGKRTDDGEGWRTVGANPGEPSPTALALIAFESRNVPVDDDAVRRGIEALLGLQKRSGYWKGSSLTGFVSTGYALNALARYFPAEPPEYTADDFTPAKNETLAQTVQRVRLLSTIERPEFAEQLVQATEHSSPLVRYWGVIGLGGIPRHAPLDPLIRGMGDRTKLVREASHWAARQALIDDRGWPEILAAAQSDDDYLRESAARALVMRVDGVLPKISVEWSKLTDALTRGMNQDAHPAVRAWSMRAAWNWWYWNPPVRQEINRAWRELLTREEPNGLVENTIRYQSHALFVVNGHHANQSKTQQYRQLSDLFADLQRILDEPGVAEAEERDRLVARLVTIAATFYAASGGDGGPGQMGYATPGADNLFGTAFTSYLEALENEPKGDSEDETRLAVALEGAANVPHEDLQQKLIHYSLNGPESLRTVAASSVSDPRSAQLVAVPEMIEPLVRQIQRGAMDPPRRSELSDPIIALFRRVRWMVPTNEEQQREILDYLIPDLEEFHSTTEVEKVDDPAERQELERQMEARWYLARELGDVLGENPDLQFAAVLDRFPQGNVNPLQARFWLPSVAWLLEFETPLPTVPTFSETPLTDGDASGKQEESSEAKADRWKAVRNAAVRLFVSQLRESADPATRKRAVDMAQSVVIRRHPDVLEALRRLPEFETNALVLKRASDVLKTQEGFERQLLAAVKREDPPRFAQDERGELEMPGEFVEDVRFFRDHVIAEMKRPQRADEQSCFSCHGVPGRVPTLTLHSPNSTGYLSMGRLLENYRLLQDRVDFESPAKSKLLRKPLNIQTGEEDGHQGGMRYRPMDRGYLLLKEWVRNQVSQADRVGREPINP